MTDKSLTSSESFAARLLRSERWRIWLTAAAMFITLIGVILRRTLGGAVMTVNSVFIPSLSVLLFGLLYQCLMLFAVRIRARRGVVIPLWQRLISITVDLLVPFSLLLFLQIQSPAARALLPFRAISPAGPARHSFVDLAPPPHVFILDRPICRALSPCSYTPPLVSAKFFPMNFPSSSATASSWR